MRKILLTIILITTCFSWLKAQQPSFTLEELSKMTIKELMNIKVEVNSKKNLPIRESPSIITVIWEEDIQKSGLRNLKEVLELFVPGFQFASAIEGSIGMSVRGMWAHHGKMLLMIDGLECNDEMFGTVFLGNHYAVDNIKKIEVSRGPGSAIYGGHASLTAINIITKTHNDKYISTSYSQMSKSYAQRYVNMNYGKQVNNFSYNINGSYSQDVRSQRNNIDYYQNSMSMNGNSDINTIFLNTNIKYKELDIRLLGDLFHYEQVDLWGTNYPKPLNQHTDTYLGKISYNFKLNDSHKLTPKFIFKYQQPWHLHVPDKNYINSKYITKYTSGLTHDWNINSSKNIITGIEYFNTILNLPENHKEYEETFKNGKNYLEISNYSIFSQAIILNEKVNVTIGGRWDYSSEYGNSFVPRIALTKAMEHLHFKTMLSQSFRIPGGIIPNRIPKEADGIVPEKATNYEIETGYNTEKFYFGINAFSITFDKYIVYGADPTTGIGTYMNSGKLGTEGIESELKYRHKNINLVLNYAYYRTTKLHVKENIVPGNEDYLLAFAPHRINSMINIDLNKTLTFSLLGEFFGKRYGYTHFDGVNHVLEKFDPELLLNTNLKANRVFHTNLDITFGISNILDTKLPYLQPYMSNHAPIPSLSRAINIKLMYHI